MWNPAIRLLRQRNASASVSSTDEAFTLIELMVVLLILAILLAIAIPTFLGVTKSANDRAAQSNLNTAVQDAKTVFQQNGQTYSLTTNATYTTPTAVLAATLSSIEPNLGFSTTAVTSGSSQSQTPQQVSVAVAADGNGIVIAAQAKGTANCWFVINNGAPESATASTPYANLSGAALNAGTAFGEAKGASTCNAATPPAVSASTTAPVTYTASNFPNL